MFACRFSQVGSSCLVLMTAASVGYSASWPSLEERNAAAKESGCGESAPDWLVQSETYAFGNSDWEALAASKVAFVTHCPVNREYFARVHALGIRAFPYVTFYQGFASQTYEDVNLKDHPEFIEVDAQGNLKRTGFWESEDAKNMYTTCPAVPEYQDAMVAWVRKIMEAGADGVFVDNLCSRVECFGPKFAKHKHVCGNANAAFAILLKRVRELVKQYKPDGAVLGNSASPASLPREFWPHLDAEMLESYICTWVSKERWFDWHKHWHEQGVKLQPFMRAGKQIQALSYLGHTPYGVRQDAFFCYATARLAGFVWNGGIPLSNPETAILYQIRLGPPLGPEQEVDDVHYRFFERGLVAVNPEKTKAGAIPIAAPAPTKLYDLSSDQAEYWAPYMPNGYNLDSTAPHSGLRCARCVNATSVDGSGAVQSVALNQSERRTLVASGWSRAENVSGRPDGDYSIYIDLTYSDGTNLFGQIAPFFCGTHDWEQRNVTIQPVKPVKSLTLYALFRGHTGRVWFDDISLREIHPSGLGPELLKNGGFEDLARGGRLVDVSTTGGRLKIPAYSGRVFLYASATGDDLHKPGPTLTVATEPGLGEVRFRVDGFDYWTHCGSWGTEYMMGPNFGKFHITFDKPGKHTVEIIDAVPADMKTPKGYGSGERLGQFMDPSQPTKPSGGKKFRFREWSGAAKAKQHRVEVEVKEATLLRAKFDVEEGKPQ
jgi:hypothetical protein